MKSVDCRLWAVGTTREVRVCFFAIALSSHVSSVTAANRPRRSKAPSVLAYSLQPTA